MFSCDGPEQDNVEFVVNGSYKDVCTWLGRASVGLSTMVDEHFGINVVEFMVSPAFHVHPFPSLVSCSFSLSLTASSVGLVSGLFWDLSGGGSDPSRARLSRSLPGYHPPPPPSLILYSLSHTSPLPANGLPRAYSARVCRPVGEGFRYDGAGEGGDEGEGQRECEGEVWERGVSEALGDEF